ncbi:response regulator [Nafulsella turpanensis]|uniref:response regulator n=1 Tax=Nafulsella turpanensis TaxID=1265690 RepID=UPI000370AACE|nr:response regulator [Nafulsella turpanensis]
MKPGFYFDCVLLVDDDPVTNFLNERTLVELGLTHHIQTTESPQEALNFISSCYKAKDDPKYMLIMLDLNMPFWDGFEFLDELQSKMTFSLNKIDIIILSSSSHLTDTERAKNYRILDYLEKPLTAEKLISALSKKLK